MRSFLSIRTLKKHVTQCIIKNKPVYEIQDEASSINVNINADRVEVQNEIICGDEKNVRGRSEEEFIDEILDEIAEIKMYHSDKNKLFKCLKKFIENISELTALHVKNDNGLNSLDAIGTVTKIIDSKINSYITRYKRKQNIEKKELYVAPLVKSLGTRFEMKLDKKSQTEKPYIVPCEIHFIPVNEMLKAFFMVDQNREAYFKNQEYKCDENTIGCFRCGDLYKKSEFFQRNPNAIQLQISTDDFELCNPIGSKGNLHKVCSVYFQIRNIPSTYTSRTDNIFVACLCNSDDLKTKSTDFNNISELIVQQVKDLEENGIEIVGGNNLKGTINCVSADNLGANLLTCLGAHGSTFYCRICEQSKTECQNATIEDVSRYRSNEKYQRILETMEQSQQINLRDSFGVVRYCKLNDLNYYNTFKNFTVDVMHDLNEGVIPLVLKKVFDYCIEKNVFKEKNLKEMIKFYSYPKLFRRDKPSEIVLKKRKNLAQNAAQIKCLLLNLPFILFKFRENQELLKVWVCVQKLIEIFQTVYTHELKKTRVNKLSVMVHEFLTSIRNCFGIRFTPKMHYMTHYETIINLIGPLIYMSTMRSEAKHKILKRIAKDTNNFININKTMAVKHQESICAAMYNGRNCEDIMSTTQLRKMDINYLKKFTSNSNLFSFIDIRHEINEVSSMTWNSYVYERESVILYKSKLYKIFTIILYLGNYFFLATQLNINGVDEFSRSIIVDTSQTQNNFDLIPFENLQFKNVYALKSIADSSFIILDNITIIDELLLH